MRMRSALRRDGHRQRNVKSVDLDDTESEVEAASPTRTAAAAPVPGEDGPATEAHAEGSGSPTRKLRSKHLRPVLLIRRFTGGLPIWANSPEDILY